MSANVEKLQSDVGRGATVMLRESTVPSRTRREEALEFRLIFLASFTFFLVAGIVARVLPGGWRPLLPGTEGHHLSIVGEAKAAAHTLAPFAFMG